MQRSWDQELRLLLSIIKGIPSFKEDEVFKVIVPLEVIPQSEYYMGSSELKGILLEFIVNSNGKTRQEINEYIYPKLNDDESTMNNRVRTALTALRKKGLIENVGSDSKSLWKKI